MVQFFIDDLEVFFPYDHVYPEQYAYMRQLKATLDAHGHGVLEMPTGTGKTVALMSLISSYQLEHPEVEKFFFCTRTVAEMEKALIELRGVLRYRLNDLLQREDRRAERANVLACALSARRNLCVHPIISREGDRDKIDESCRQLTAPWVRNSHGENAGDLEEMFQNVNDCRLCPWYEALDSEWNVESMPVDVYTIEDLKNFGSTGKNPILDEETTNLRRLRAKYDVIRMDDEEESPGRVNTRFCSYFASRRMAQAASVLILNYQYVLDPRVSQVAFGSSGLMSGKGQVLANRFAKKDAGETSRAADPWVIVFDEAHNIDNVCIEALSINLSVLDVEKARVNVRRLQKLIAEKKVHDQQSLRTELEQMIRGTDSGSQITGSQVTGNGGRATDLTQSVVRNNEYESMLQEHMASPLLPNEQQMLVNALVPGNIRKAELFLMNMHVIIVYLDDYIRQFKVVTEGPLSFLKKLEEKTTISSDTLQHFYERLKNLFISLQVTDIREYMPLTKIADFCTLVSTYWKGFVLITDPYPEAPGIYDPITQLCCVDSSLAMKPVLEKFQSVVLTSGTISPLYLYPRLLGFQPVVTQSFPMSLDRKCICPMVVGKGPDQIPLSSAYELREDAAVVRNYGRLLTEFARTVPDGIVCFFTSYQYMELIISKWYKTGVINELMRYKLLLMETKDIVTTTLALDSYRKCCDNGRGAIFFSVARGKVAEGIDFDRHYGRCVMLFGVPFQYTLSKVLKARLEFMKETYKVPESEFLSFDAMRQAAQCIGRVIRSKTDYGLMVLADYRYGRADKRKKLPEWVLECLDPHHTALSVDVAVQVARDFLIEMSQPYQISMRSRLDFDALQKLHKLTTRIKQKQDVKNETEQEAVVKDQPQDIKPATTKL
ncbi:DNA repair helicase [Gregarina niphandrodes]|uniref:DNA 5'-3' helicase n=1 Tax=Gregarina niphandrodes TaxID=110365 RepID=A0A023B467_GRENI|nr:DNA repair helicase [Gregarina niphandrodes]EZG56010.1 DNA repair helicase [Gregarina niphandrodes]|eukprot:XP_011131378.1 DNA repair helicase [Gregarina niphandrodes]